MTPEQKRYLEQCKVRDEAAAMRLNEWLREFIESGRVKKLMTTRDVSLNDTERALEEWGGDMGEALQKGWNV